MIYSSPEFLLLFAAALACYCSVRSAAARSVVLVAASACFYAWTGLFDTALFASVIALSWGAGAMAVRRPSQARVWLGAGIGFMLLNLMFWKYAAWLCGEVQSLVPGFLGGRKVSLPLPVGVSFYTLQGVAYLVDLGRGDAEWMPFGRYVLFKGFFAQLIAGPIVRARQLLPQLEVLRRPRWEELSTGLALFMMGIAKKLLLADKLSPLVDHVFADPVRYDRSALLLALAAYTVQIWGDFSGYTDMGRGAARMMGLELPENFLSPYLARTPSEFWRRWHATLGAWIRDYLYYPLAVAVCRGRRTWRLLPAAVLLFSMGVCGLWHGARWTFVAWGLYHGLLLALEQVLPWRRGLLGWCLTLPAVAIGWLLFRAPSFSAFFDYLHALGAGTGAQAWSSARSVYAGIAVCGLLHLLFWRDLDTGRPLVRIPRPPDRAWAGALAGLALAAVFVGAVVLRPLAVKAFIYFQF